MCSIFGYLQVYHLPGYFMLCEYLDTFKHAVYKDTSCCVNFWIPQVNHSKGYPMLHKCLDTSNCTGTNMCGGCCGCVLSMSNVQGIPLVCISCPGENGYLSAFICCSWGVIATGYFTVLTWVWILGCFHHRPHVRIPRMLGYFSGKSNMWDT